MPTLVYNGTREQFLADQMSVIDMLTGRTSDPLGVTDGLKLRMGTVLLGKIQDAYEIKAEGGADAMGIIWEPLSTTTLALRRKNTGAKVLDRVKAMLKKRPSYRAKLYGRQFKRLMELYDDTDEGATARRRAKRVLRKMRGFVGDKRYQKMLGELKTKDKARQKRIALAGAAAEILLDTRRLFNSLGPGTVGNILTMERGAIIVGTNVEYAAYHQHGTQRIPKRQFLPDEQHPIPSDWWRDMRDALQEGLASEAFWRRVLGSRVG